MRGSGLAQDPRKGYYKSQSKNPGNPLPSQYLSSLQQRSADYFYKEPLSKCFTIIILQLSCESTHRQYVNKYVCCVLINLFMDIGK